MYKYIYFTARVQFWSCSNIYLNIPVSPSKKKSFSGDNSIFRDFHVVTCCNHDRNEGVIVFSSNTLKGSIYSQATPLPSKEVFLYLKTL